MAYRKYAVNKKARSRGPSSGCKPYYQRDYLAGTTTMVSPPVLPRLPVAPVSPVFPVAPVSPVFPVFPVAPVDPVAPVAPAGPGTGVGTVITVAGATTAGRMSHALNVSAISTAENNIEYFIGIPLDWLTKTAHLDRFAGIRSYGS
jgi:hypothetical protein